MPRFFVEPGQIRDGYIYLTGQDVVHITRVLRLGRGDRILVLDGRGKSYQAVIEDAGRTRVICAVTGEIPVFSSPGPRLTLVQGLPKGDKMDLIVEKSTELGISRIIPLVCERTVLKLEGDKLSRRRERWLRIAREASKQCRRPDVPEVDLPGGWDQALRDLDRATALIPWEEENVLTLKSFLRENKPREQVYVFTGPEGGFTPREVERARSHGVRPVTLGPRILRTETAGLAVVAMILYQWGDLGGRSDG
jgi:16S rRNA (uracil1498-N3)-methyltransferase